MARARELILQALDNLTEEELKRFKHKLSTVQLRDGFSRIPRGSLTGWDRLQLSSHLVSRYLEDYGMELTAEVLRAIGMLEEAVRLQQAAGQGIRSNPDGNAAQVTQHSAATSTPPGKHFVDMHRTDLINRVNQLDPILDQLLENVLNQEQYDAIRAESTSQEQMRKLYSYIRSWSNRCKDLFFEALKKTHPFLVEDLEGQ
ncbi:apoptosis-associated speck-like protein containing a CARD [Macrotis lagotis]|uniref:apoptosis-associated speck-like protein containing a CARD n=1 Tax=Macrotis lagotis TaxID=92651 RepID=UPI003D69FCFD